MVSTNSKWKPRVGRKNPVLVPGIHRFGKSKMFHKKGIWAKQSKKFPKQEKVKKPLVVKKPIGSDKNGGHRLKILKKSKRYHPTALCNKRRKVNRTHVVPRRRLRGSLKPGTVCIMLAGRYAGRRVVFLKQLDSGLVLITGPFKVNSVPMRRVNQQYLIATSVRLDFSKLKMPKEVNDDLFARDRKSQHKARKDQQGEIFSDSVSAYQVSDQRKTLQADVDKQVLSSIKTHPEKKQLFKYLGSAFWLRTSQLPHTLKF